MIRMRRYFFFWPVGFMLLAGFSIPVPADPPKKINQTVRKPSASEKAAPSGLSTQKVAQSLSALPGDATQDEIARFCRNINDKAQDARFELQMRQLGTLRSEIDERIGKLEEKRKEYEDWLARRNAFLTRTQDSFVSIISKMRPDVAAAQLALVDEMAAASVILKLEPRISSAIMNELPSEKSANLIRILVSAQKVPPEKTVGGMTGPAKALPK